MHQACYRYSFCHFNTAQQEHDRIQKLKRQRDIEEGICHSILPQHMLCELPQHMLCEPYIYCTVQNVQTQLTISLTLMTSLQFQTRTVLLRYSRSGTSFTSFATRSKFEPAIISFNVTWISFWRVCVFPWKVISTSINCSCFHSEYYTANTTIYNIFHSYITPECR